jgi:FMN phosphatase YigB (HAD superfamily)
MSQSELHSPKFNVRTWLVDFDETLATGNLTWALQYTIPKFTQEYQLNYDEKQLGQIILVLQERSRQYPDTPTLLTALFDMMEWPHSLQNQFMTDLRSSYRPVLFEDTLPFLKQSRKDGRAVYVVSNNKRTPEHVNLLQLDGYIEGIFTPHTCANTKPKPHISLWRYITERHIEIDPQTTAIIGDDPWADGAFADACGIPCWIIDRTKRFAQMYPEKPYHWIQSLQDIAF